MERQNLHFSLLGDAPPTTQRSKLIAGMLCLGGALGFVAGRFTASSPAAAAVRLEGISTAAAGLETNASLSTTASATGSVEIPPTVGAAVTTVAAARSPPATSYA